MRRDAIIVLIMAALAVGAGAEVHSIIVPVVQLQTAGTSHYYDYDEESWETYYWVYNYLGKAYDSTSDYGYWNHEYAYIKFDCSRIPQDSSVQEAYLRFYFDQIEDQGRGDLKAYRILEDWDTFYDYWDKPAIASDRLTWELVQQDGLIYWFSIPVHLPRLLNYGICLHAVEVYDHDSGYSAEYFIHAPTETALVLIVDSESVQHGVAEVSWGRIKALGE